MKQILTLKENTKGITSPEDLFKKVKKINIDYTQENFLISFFLSV